MRNKYKIIAPILSLVIFLPIIVFAATTGANCNGGNIVPCNGSAQCPCDFTAFAHLINNVINWFITISVSVAAVTFSIAGFKILFNPENPAKRQEAMGMFKKTIIGMLLVLGAWLIVHTIVTALVDPKINALRYL
jgi:hypothetical protein